MLKNVSRVTRPLAHSSFPSLRTHKANSDHDPSRRVGVFWDSENTGRFRDALDCLIFLSEVKKRVNRPINFVRMYEDIGVDTLASQYLSASGVDCIRFSAEGRKEIADHLITGDMFAFAFEHPESTIVVITRDSDFGYPLHLLAQRGHEIILVSSTLRDTSSTVVTAASTHNFHSSDEIARPILNASEARRQRLLNLHFIRQRVGRGKPDSVRYPKLAILSSSTARRPRTRPAPSSPSPKIPSFLVASSSATTSHVLPAQPSPRPLRPPRPEVPSFLLRPRPERIKKVGRTDFERIPNPHPSSKNYDAIFDSFSALKAASSKPKSPPPPARLIPSRFDINESSDSTLPSPSPPPSLSSKLPLGTTPPFLLNPSRTSKPSVNFKRPETNPPSPPSPPPPPSRSPFAFIKKLIQRAYPPGSS